MFGSLHGPIGCIKAKGQKETTHENVKIKIRRTQSSLALQRDPPAKETEKERQQDGRKTREVKSPGGL